MKYLVALVFLAVAVSAKECSEKRAESCVESLLESILEDTSEEEICSELQSSISCLRTAVDECTEGKDDQEVEEGLEELAKVFQDNCESERKDETEDDDEDEATAKCIAENEEYVFECMEEATAASLALMMESDDPSNADAALCSMYALVATCFVERLDEKCGKEAAKIAEDEFRKMPVTVANACAASEGFIAHTFELLGGEDRRRKK